MRFPLTWVMNYIVLTVKHFQLRCKWEHLFCITHQIPHPTPKSRVQEHPLDSWRCPPRVGLAELQSVSIVLHVQDSPQWCTHILVSTDCHNPACFFSSWALHHTELVKKGQFWLILENIFKCSGVRESRIRVILKFKAGVGLLTVGLQQVSPIALGF